MTYNGILHEWKQLSASRNIDRTAFTPAGILSLTTTGDEGILDLAPLDTLSAATREHERRRLVEDAKMVGLHITATAIDERGAYHYRVTIERAPTNT